MKLIKVYEAPVTQLCEAGLSRLAWVHIVLFYTVLSDIFYRFLLPDLLTHDRVQLVKPCNTTNKQKPLIGSSCPIF